MKKLHFIILSPHKNYFIILCPSTIFQSFLFSVLPHCICTPMFTAILLSSPISSIYVLPSSFQPHCLIVLAPCTTLLFTALTSSYFSPLSFLLGMFISLSVAWRECNIATQLQMSAKQVLFSLSFLCMHGQHWRPYR